MSDQATVVATIPFSDQELQLVSERAAAHGMSVVDFVRAIVLTRPTWLEALPCRLPCGRDSTSSSDDRSIHVPL